jgi:hypothetical protein
MDVKTGLKTRHTMSARKKVLLKVIVLGDSGVSNVAGSVSAGGSMQAV